jgi:hypothetical protein
MDAQRTPVKYRKRTQISNAVYVRKAQDHQMKAVKLLKMWVVLEKERPRKEVGDSMHLNNQLTVSNLFYPQVHKFECPTYKDAALGFGGAHCVVVNVCQWTANDGCTVITGYATNEAHSTHKLVTQ